MASDPDLLAAFRKQCQFLGPGMALLLWKGQKGVDLDDLLDIFKKKKAIEDDE
jgi:hypothetical protein